MTLDTITENRSSLLACEALGWLHNIGKLDKRFFHHTFDYAQLVDPSEILELASEKMEFLAKISAGKTSDDFHDMAQRVFAEVSPDKDQKEFDENWVKYARTDKPLLPLPYVLMAHGLGQHFATGCLLLLFRFQEGVNLPADIIENFINRYIGCRAEKHGTLTALPVLGNNFSFAMLLNLFWDKFHWRPDPDKPERYDNLTCWLGKEYEEFARFAQVMAICHEAISRGDKGPERIRRPRGEWTNVFASDEQKFQRLDSIADLLKEKQIPEILAAFRGCGSDGNLPINDVSLHSYCANFGAFLKTALAAILLTGKIPEHPYEMRWRLIWFRHDGPSWISRGGRLADIIARRDCWTGMLDEIQKYLEIELPLAQEIYRDSEGAFYLAPDIEGLDRTKIAADDKAPTLAEKVAALGLKATNNEITVELKLSDPCRGYEINIAALMEKYRPRPCNPDPAAMEKCWHTQEDGKDTIIHAEVCTVCHLRPIPKKGVASIHRVCKVCHKRRTGRAGAWKENKNKNNMAGTVWITELGDGHGRCALLAGRLGITPWIGGDMFQSLEKKWLPDKGLPDQGPSGGPSFTRVRDVWNMSEQFWQEIGERLLDPSSQPLSPVAGRWHLKVKDANGKNRGLEENHAYEIEVNGARLQVVCLNGDGPVKTLCVIDRRASDPGQGWDLEPGTPLPCLVRGGYGRRTTSIEGITLAEKPEYDHTPFSPCIELLHDPHRFFAILPADQAVAAADWIREKYRQKYKFVHDRLPLQLGIVYFPEKSPAYTVLDAGLKMVARDFVEESAQLLSFTEENGQRLLTVAGEFAPLAWPASVCGKDDHWYGRPKIDGKYTVASQAATGKNISWRPSTLDILYLSRTSKRHHVVYRDGQRRDSDFGAMPLPLSGLDEMERIWRHLSGLTRSQLGSIEAMREYARNELAGADKKAIHFFLTNSLRTGGDDWWQKKLTKKDRDLLEHHSGPDGLVWTALKHRLHLLKEKPANEQTAASQSSTRETTA